MADLHNLEDPEDKDLRFDEAVIPLIRELLPREFPLLYCSDQVFGHVLMRPLIF